MAEYFEKWYAEQDKRREAAEVSAKKTEIQSLLDRAKRLQAQL